MNLLRTLTCFDDFSARQRRARGGAVAGRGDKPAARSQGRHHQGSPVGISFEVSGDDTTALGKSYSDGVNAYRGTEEAPRAPELGGSEPDGILVSQDTGERFCVEAKFIEDGSESLYNPDLRRFFPHNQVRKTFDQTLKYADHCTEGVEWYTNSLDFVRTYSSRFKEAGVKNFTFTIIPASRVKP